MLFFELFSLNLSRLFHCSVIKVLCPAVLRDNSYILSQLSAFVNRFFHFFISFAPHHCAVDFYNSTKLYACQLFFSLFLFIFIYIDKAIHIAGYIAVAELFQQLCYWCVMVIVL